MSKKIIIIGDLSKKTLLPFLSALANIALNMIIYYFPGDRQNIVLDLYSSSFGMLSVTFIPYIFKFADIDKCNDQFRKKKKCINYTLLVLAYAFYSITQEIPSRMKASLSESQNIINYLAQGPFLYIGVEMILLTIVSIFLLKYKYYNHHFISMAAFIIFGTISDIILNYYPHMAKYGLLINTFEFLRIFADVIYYYYQKYMMEILFYPYWKISFCIGICVSFTATLLLIYVLTDPDKADSKIPTIADFYLYFTEVHPGLIIGKQLIIIVLYLISFSLTMLNIYYFNPNYILISYHIAKVVNNIIDLIKGEPEKLYSLIFFVLQFLSLMIYLEIIELNFCKMNENTKRNINLRGLLDMDGESDRKSTKIDINKDYYIDTSINDGQKDNNIEMVPHGSPDSTNDISSI
jgi:hypothetical protein